MPVSATADIQDRDDVIPNSSSTFYGLLKELVRQRGEAHVYLANHRDQGDAHDDIHIEKDRVYFEDEFGREGLIFIQDNGVQRWIAPEAILYIETHE